MLTIKICPKCKSTNVRPVGQRWMCGDCGYVGNDFVEKEITNGQIDSIDKRHIKWRNN